MFALIWAYLCVPERFRFIVRWIAAGFVLMVLVLVLILFTRILHTMPVHHGNLFRPEPHQPSSPDFISHLPRHNVTLRSVREN
jgi:hypothetical protein